MCKNQITVIRIFIPSSMYCYLVQRVFKTFLLAVLLILSTASTKTLTQTLTVTSRHLLSISPVQELRKKSNTRNNRLKNFKIYTQWFFQNFVPNLLFLHSQKQQKRTSSAQEAPRYGWTLVKRSKLQLHRDCSPSYLATNNLRARSNMLRAMFFSARCFLLLCLNTMTKSDLERKRFAQLSTFWSTMKDGKSGQKPGGKNYIRGHERVLFTSLLLLAS